MENVSKNLMNTPNSNKLTRLELNSKPSELELLKLKCKYSEKRKSLPNDFDDSFEQFLENDGKKSKRRVRSKSETEAEKVENYNIGTISTLYSILNTPSSNVKKMSRSTGKKTVRTKHRDKKCKKRLTDQYKKTDVDGDSFSETMNGSAFVPSDKPCLEDQKSVSGLFQNGKETGVSLKNESKRSSKRKLKQKVKETEKTQQNNKETIVSANSLDEKETNETLNKEITIVEVSLENCEREKDRPKPKINAFQVMMESRYKSIGTNSPGKEKEIEEEEEDNKNKKKNEIQKRKLMFEKWADTKGGQKRKLQDELQEEYINETLQKRAKRLKRMLKNQAESKDNEACDRKNKRNLQTSPSSNSNSKKRKKIVKLNSDSDDSDENNSKYYDDSRENRTIKSPNHKNNDLLDYFDKDIKPKKHSKKIIDVVEDVQEKSNSVIKISFPFTPKKKKSSKSPESRRKRKHKLSLKKKNRSDEKEIRDDTHDPKNDSIVLISDGNESAIVTNVDVEDTSETTKMLTSPINDLHKNRVQSKLHFGTKTPEESAVKNKTPKGKWKLKIKCNESNERTEGVENRTSRLTGSETDLEIVDVENNEMIFSPVKKTTHFKLKIAMANKIKNKAIKFSSPKKGPVLSPAKTDVKSKDVKLAPLFLTKNFPPPKRDSGVCEAKRNFLSSGVPNVVKKIVEKQKRIIEDCAFEVFPAVSHVQQTTEPIKNCIDVWNLPKVDLKFLKNEFLEFDSKSFFKNQKPLRRDFFSDATVETALKMNYGLPQKIVNFRIILQQIKNDSPDFPVYKMFRLLRERSVCKYKNCQLDSKKQNETKDKTFAENKPQSKQKKKKRGSLRKNDKIIDDLDKSVEIIEITDSSNSNLLEENKLYSMWSEKYKPNSSEEIIGNSNSVRELKQWLQSWLDFSRNAKQNIRIDNGNSSDDFIVSDEDTRDSSQSPGNTVVLVGPSGSGKTSAVYALTNELSINVLEINASSKRPGKKILLDLQEATQSHLVSKGPVNNSQDCNIFSEKSIDGAPDGKKRGETINGKKLDDYFVVKNNANKNKENIKKKDPAKIILKLQKASKKEKAITASENLCSQNSSNMSLILVEDIDLFFEDQDEGFISAITTLCNSSKRPVILISSDASNCFVKKFAHQNQVITFSPLPGVILGTWLRLICLLEGVFVDRSSVENLLEKNHGDMRKTLLQLQFWVNSGGNVQNVKSKLDVCTLDKTVTEEINKRIEDVDESSRMSWLSNEDCSDLVVSVHEKCMQSFLGLYLNETVNAEKYYLTYPVDLGNVYWNIHTILNCPELKIKHKLVKQNTYEKTSEDIIATMKFVIDKINGKFKDENSEPKTDSELDANPGEVKPENGCDFEENDTDNKRGDNFEMNRDGAELKMKYESTCSQSEMDTVCSLYDYLTLTDTALTQIGLYDKEPASNSKACNLTDSLCVVEDFRSYSHLKQQSSDWTYYLIEKTVSRCRTVFKTEHEINTVTPATEEIKWRSKQHASNDVLLDAVPMSNILDNRSVFTDYQPVLRTVCRYEQHRHSTNTKRRNRFYHYLKNLNVHCNDNTFDILCATLMNK